MARPLRIEFPGALYHVHSRGNRRADVFLDDDDRRSFLDLVEEATSRFTLVVHAYCLMGNHYHLLVETPRGNLSRALRHVNGVYAQRFNARHHTVGHLFQARYRALLVEKESHGLEVARYVVRNPVRAGLCAAPAEWPWSSYRATAGLVPRPRWLATDWILGQFGGTRAEAEERYRRFVEEGDRAAPRAHGGLYVGTKEFARNHAPAARIPEVPRRHVRPVRPQLAELLQRPTDAAIAAAYAEGYTLAEIGHEIGRHYTTVSRRLRAFERAAAARRRA